MERKIRLIIFGFLVLALVPNFFMMDASAATPGAMYASTRSVSATPGAVFEVSQTGPLVETLIGDPTPSGGMSGLAFDSTTKLFGSTAPGSGLPSNLIEIHPTTGALIFDFGVIVDLSSIPVKIADLSVQPGTDIIFGMTSATDIRGSGQLFTISQTTPPIATPVGPHNGFTGRELPIAFAPDGTLFMTDNLATLYTVSPITGAILTTVPLSTGMNGLGVRSDGTIFGVVGGGAVPGTPGLYTISVTGTATLVGASIEGFTDIDFVPDVPVPVGGTLIPIDMASLFLTATQLNVANYNEDFQVPSWFVTVEKWFKDGKISDSEFSKATQYLKNTNIITEIQTELKSAAIIDQLHNSIPNPEFQQKVKQYMQESGYKVDIYTTDDITVDFYKKLPSMNYEFIYIRTHSLEDLTSEQPTFLFTGEKYDTEKHTNEQQLGQVFKGIPIYEQELSGILKNKESMTEKMYFVIGSKMIDELMVGTFPQSVIIIGGCESLRSYDLANSLISRGASAVIGWDSTINSDENDEVMLSFLEMILSENYDIPDAARLINEKYSPDMEFSSKLKGAFNSEYNYLLE